MKTLFLNNEFCCLGLNLKATSIIYQVSVLGNCEMGYSYKRPNDKKDKSDKFFL